MTIGVISEVEVNHDIISDSKYDLMFSVEEVNRRTLDGTPFRDAYKQVALEIGAGEFIPRKEINHTHEGSIGNLCNEAIAALVDQAVAGFNFERVIAAERKLLEL